MSGSRTVTVSIFGRQYTLSSETDPQRLQSLAAQVDARMREAANTCGPLAADRLAILVALNLADDLARANQTASDVLAGSEGLIVPGPRIERLLAILDDEVGNEGVHGV